MNWKPLPVAEIKAQLAPFDRWCLCGGQAIDLLAGRQTRDHGDTDLGVFRSDLASCLDRFPKRRVFLCDPPGTLVGWDGGPIPTHVSDLWIADEEKRHWILQIMVFDDEGDLVFYRRDRRLAWKKASHTWTVDGLRALNPMITLLYKSNKQNLEDKDWRDLKVLIEEIGVASSPSRESPS